MKLAARRRAARAARNVKLSVVVWWIAMLGGVVGLSCSSDRASAGRQTADAGSPSDACSDRPVFEAGTIPEPDSATVDDGGACYETDEQICQRLHTECGPLVAVDLCHKERNVAECGPCLAEVGVCQDGTCVALSASWKVGTWSSCSKSCNGVQTRTVTCVREDGVKLGDVSCSGGAKPATSRSCNPPHCEPVSACGDDGCGNSCGTCKDSYGSHAVACRKGVCTWIIGTGEDLPCNTTCGWGSSPCLWVESTAHPNATCSTGLPDITCYCRAPE